MLILAALAAAACGDGETAPPPDGGPAPPPAGCGATVGLACPDDAWCDDGCFCNGAEACVGGVCAAATPACADDVACTVDTCDEVADACEHAPDDAACGDADACNGAETCDPGAGCVSGEPLRCADESACTVDTCDPVAGCVYLPRDLDGDGHVDSVCGGDDCNDDPRTGAVINPGVAEVCDDGVDQDCDDLPDGFDPDCPTDNDTCAAPRPLAVGVTYNLFGLAADHGTSCGAEDARDAVFTWSLAEPRDVTLSIAAARGPTVLAVRRLADCEDPAADLGCGSGPPVFPPSLFLRGLPAGDYAVLVQAADETAFSFDLVTAAPTQIDACAADAAPLPAAGFAFEAGEWTSVDDDHELSCGADARPEAVYRLVLAEAASLAVTGLASGGGTIRVALSTACDTPDAELACATGTLFASFDRTALPAGTYFVLVEQGDDTSTGWSLNVAVTDAAP